jgi:hypothetical protein
MHSSAVWASQTTLHRLDTSREALHRRYRAHVNLERTYNELLQVLAPRPQDVIFLGTGYKCVPTSSALALRALALHPHTALSRCTLALHSRTAPSRCTLALHPRAARSRCTLTLHSHTPPSHCTLALHPRTARLHCTPALHSRTTLLFLGCAAVLRRDACYSRGGHSGFLSFIRWVAKRRRVVLIDEFLSS